MLRGRSFLGAARKVLLALAGITVGLGLAEALLRARYDELPSLVPLSEAGLEWAPSEGGGDCHLTKVHRISRIRSRPPLGTGEARRVWVAGDSTTHGTGLPQEGTWWFQLGEGLADRVRLGVTDLSVPGAGSCGLRMQVLEGEEAAPLPDLVLVGVFADDLLEHALLSVRGQQVLLPSAAPPALRGVVTRSYLANIVWFALDRRRVSAHARSLSDTADEAFQRMVDDLAAWSADKGVHVTYVLIPPSGLAACPPVSEPQHACSWLVDDQAHMARLLAQAGADVIDLRDAPAGPFDALELDVEAVREGRMQVALHMSAEGNAAIARALGPEVLRRLPADGED